MHPHLFQFGRLVLPTYGFLVALSAIVSLLVCVRTARLLSLDTDKVWSVALVATFTAVMGNRILLTLLNWPRYGVRALSVGALGAQNPGVGFAGATLAVAAGVFCAWRRGLPILRTADAFGPSLALAHSIVSIGCLEAGCDYGTPSNLPWAIIFLSRTAMPGTPLGVPLHPTQLYASLISFVLFVVLLWLVYRPHQDGEIMGAWLFLGGLSSFLLTFLRGDAGPLLAGLVPVMQIVAAVMVFAGALLWLQRPQVQKVSHGG